jgi:hypothetical protein
MASLIIYFGARGIKLAISGTSAIPPRVASGFQSRGAAHYFDSLNLGTRETVTVTFLQLAITKRNQKALSAARCDLPRSFLAVRSAKEFTHSSNSFAGDGGDADIEKVRDLSG